MSTQHDFVAALLDPQRDCPADLKVWNGSAPAARFAVYRNNVLSSLIDALAASCPVVQQLVGSDFFRAMAAVYVRNSPPRSPILADYGASFPGFIETFAPASGLPYLADVARLELLRVRAYHAADAEALASDVLTTALAAPDSLGALLLRLHPSLGLLDSAFAVVSLWGAHQGALALADVDPYQAQCALVLRHELEVEVIGIRQGDVHFIQALQQQQPLGRAAEHAFARDNAFDLGACLTQLLRTGAIIHSSYASERQRP